MPKVPAEPTFSVAKIVRECGACRGTIFLAPIQRGEIINGVFVARVTLYTCNTCHKVAPLEDLPERVPLAG